MGVKRYGMALHDYFEEREPCELPDMPYVIAPVRTTAWVQTHHVHVVLACMVMDSRILSKVCTSSSQWIIFNPKLFEHIPECRLLKPKSRSIATESTKLMNEYSVCFRLLPWRFRRYQQ